MEEVVKKLVLLLLAIMCISIAEQAVFTDDRVEVMLKEDSTYNLVDTSVTQYSPFAIKRDSQRVFLYKIVTRGDISDEETSIIDSTESDTIYINGESGVTQKDESDTVSYHEVEKKPEPIRIPSPGYPKEARMVGAEGLVILKVLINFDGTILDVKVLNSSGNYGLDQAAINSGYGALFTPAVQGGRKVRVWVSIPFRFQLTGK